MPKYLISSVKKKKIYIETWKKQVININLLSVIPDFYRVYGATKLTWPLINNARQQYLKIYPTGPDNAYSRLLHIFLNSQASYNIAEKLWLVKKNIQEKKSINSLLKMVKEMISQQPFIIPMLPFELMNCIKHYQEKKEKKKKASICITPSHNIKCIKCNEKIEKKIITQFCLCSTMISHEKCAVPINSKCQICMYPIINRESKRVRNSVTKSNDSVEKKRKKYLQPKLRQIINNLCI